MRSWLRAAAAYNVAWGTAVAVAPGTVLGPLGVDPVDELPWRLAAMFVLLYAPAYWWAAHDPVRHGGLLALALAGKLIGPAGFLVALATGDLPLRFGLTILTNDLVWLPALVICLRRSARARGGWRVLALRG